MIWELICLEPTYDQMTNEMFETQDHDKKIVQGMKKTVAEIEQVDNAY